MKEREKETCKQQSSAGWSWGNRDKDHGTSLTLSSEAPVLSTIHVSLSTISEILLFFLLIMAGSISDACNINGSDLISALYLAQQAPTILGQESQSKSSTASADTAEYYARIEQLLLACLRTGDDQSAQACLNRLSLRFGPSNERIMGLRGLFEEATAKDHSALEKCLQEYDQILSQSPVNIVSMPMFSVSYFQLTTCQPILKRRVALLRSLNRSSDAISALIQLLTMPFPLMPKPGVNWRTYTSHRG